MAPEYAMHGNFSVKSDVYSFGVLVLEIVSGEKNNCFCEGEYVEDLPNHVSNFLKNYVCHNKLIHLAKKLTLAIYCVHA